MATMITNANGAQLAGFSRGLTAKLPVAAHAPAAQASAPTQAGVRRRKFSPQAGRAIEKLAHAIEYLLDEFALESISGDSVLEYGINSRIAAIYLLKRLNREVYLSCPIEPTFAERMRTILRWPRA